MHKLLYVEVVKKNLNINQIERKQIIYKNNLTSRINRLLDKLLKDENSNNINKIKNIIIHTDNSIDELIISIVSINKLITNTKYTYNKNHIWISDKLIELLIRFNYTSNINIVDIGGGEGNILNYISRSFNIPSNNLFVVEQQQEWAEKYLFKKNINYLFWNNIDIDIKSDSIDIILIMVSLHHMTDNTINSLLLNINRILKSNGLIIIKEHNCKTMEDIKVIDWEHHLYHILMSPRNDINEDTIRNYLLTFINNYKSIEEYNNIFAKYNFKNILNLNRSFEQYVSNDKYNATNLYWALYQKNSL